MKLEVFSKEPNGDAQNCNDASIPASRLFVSMCGDTFQCPSFQCHLDKSFGLAIGLWPVWPGSFIPDTDLPACFTKFAGFVAGPIIRKDTLDLHAPRRISVSDMPEEFHSRFRRLVRVDRCSGHTRSIISANMQIFPAGPLLHLRLSVSAAGKNISICLFRQLLSPFSRAFSTIQPVASRKKRGFSAHFWPGSAVPSPSVSSFSKLKHTNSTQDYTKSSCDNSGGMLSNSRTIPSRLWTHLAFLWRFPLFLARLL